MILNGVSTLLEILLTTPQRGQEVAVRVSTLLEILPLVWSVLAGF